MEPAPTPLINGGRFAINADVSFLDRGKIPSIVRDLPDFDGDARALSNWILDVEDCLELYEDFRERFEYHLVLKTIRRKIKNEANDILISNNTPNDWSQIKEVLRLYYADKRDLMTLDNQMKDMTRQNNETIETYYSRVREMITLISSAITTDESWRGHEAAIIKLYNMKALDTFIRGLGDPLSLFVKNFKPKSLAAAYHYCIDFMNLKTRNAAFKPQLPQPIPAPRGGIPIPPRPPMPKPPLARHNPVYRHPHHVPPPRNFFQPQPPNAFAPNRTFYPQQPRPEPMDVDRSIQSRRVDYGNRPNFKFPRPTTDSMNAHNPPTKRVAHQLENYTEEEYNNLVEEDFQHLSNPYAEDYSEPYPVVDVETEETETFKPEENSNVNFLENDTEWVSKWFD